MKDGKIIMLLKNTVWALMLTSSLVALDKVELYLVNETPYAVSCESGPGFVDVFADGGSEVYLFATGLKSTYMAHCMMHTMERHIPCNMRVDGAWVKHDSEGYYLTLADDPAFGSFCERRREQL